MSRAIDDQTAALHAALWRDPEGAIDAYEAGALDPDRWHPEHRPLVAAIAAVIESGRVAEPERVLDALMAAGKDRRDAWELVLMPGVFEALDCRSGTVSEHLTRERVRRRLVALADALDSPTGPARVAAVLLWEAA